MPTSSHNDRPRWKNAAIVSHLLKTMKTTPVKGFYQREKTCACESDSGKLNQCDSLRQLSTRETRMIRLVLAKRKACITLPTLR